MFSYNPDPELYTTQQIMLDFNTLPDSSEASVKVVLQEDYELTNEMFGVYTNQQGDVVCSLREIGSEFRRTNVSILMFDESGQCLDISTTCNGLTKPMFIKGLEPMTLVAGTYTIQVSPLWGLNEESSDLDPEVYKSWLLSLYYPSGAKFGKLSIE